MDEATLKKVQRKLRRDRTLFYWFPDRDSLLLLAWAAGEGIPVRELKAGPFGKLLRRKSVKERLATVGDGRLSAAEVESWWPAKQLTYRLGLSRWPKAKEPMPRAWQQITRDGVNLVVQLNFAMSHNRKVLESVDSPDELPVFTGHPVAKVPEITLAWARLDLDLERGEVLIEEIQSDWVRQAEGMAMWRYAHPAWATYSERILGRFRKDWARTMIAAVLWLLRTRLGVTEFFMHQWESGSRLKRIQGRPPPRSLYTDLPKRLCFSPTHNPPAFLLAERGRRVRKLMRDPETAWWVLHL